MKLRVALAIAALLTVAPVRSFPRSRSLQKPPASTSRASWTVLNNCVYVSNQSNDGDSFHVSAGGKQYLFRLYFVDAPETDAEFKDRVDEQAKYFGITDNDVVRMGKIAKDFTRTKLGQPFTVRTCFQDALGRSRMQRLYAIVQTATGDLGEQLVENGLARIHGASANPVGLPSANVEWRKLRQLEIAAKGEKVGGWGVNFGRMLARSEKSKNRAPLDPFEAFFHPEGVQTAGPATASTSAAPALPTDDIVSINPDHSGNNPAAQKQTLARANEGKPARPTPPPIAAAISPAKAATVNINTATQKQLEDIPGIGPVLAQRIMAARPFKDGDDLRRVKGIGIARYQKLRPFFE